MQRPLALNIPLSGRRKRREKYPFTPELLDALPEELAELFRALEITLLDEICSRLGFADQLNEVTVQDIQALRMHGIDLKSIEEAISKTAGISKQKLNSLLNDVVERNQKYYTEVIDLAHVTQPETLVNAATVDAIKRQAHDTFRNLTASMGFLVGNTMLKPARAYQWALDNAEMQIQSGAISYNQAIKTAVKQLADSGLKVVDYESGHRDQIDVAARRAVMTGVNQICAKYTEQSAEYLETPYLRFLPMRAHAIFRANHRGHLTKHGKASYIPLVAMTFTPAFTMCAGLGPLMDLRGLTADTAVTFGLRA